MCVCVRQIVCLCLRRRVCVPTCMCAGLRVLIGTRLCLYISSAHTHTHTNRHNLQMIVTGWRDAQPHWPIRCWQTLAIWMPSITCCHYSGTHAPTHNRPRMEMHTHSLAVYQKHTSVQHSYPCNDNATNFAHFPDFYDVQPLRLDDCLHVMCAPFAATRCLVCGVQPCAQ